MALGVRADRTAGAHHQQAQTVELRVTITGALWSRLEEELERLQLPDRMMYALYPVAMGHRTRWAVYQKDAELSEQQALRDIRDLARAGSERAGLKRGEKHRHATTSPHQGFPTR
jgi:hypothetical protein